ncbi:MAG: bifunctional DedA family/phosphatase PAP2 family protein [Candidatus Paceibacterota bacterium]|jgi:membrane protein DedA with SNARE-associated domain
MPYAHVFSAFVGHIETFISQGGYFFLFIFTILEGIPLFGMVIPGHIAIIASGFLAKIGTLDLLWVLVISGAGAIIGDYIGFYFGRKYGMAFIEKFRPYFFITDAHIEKAQTLLNKHTGKALIMGRFTPATRSLMPFLVGASHTPAGRFWFFNIIGGITWVTTSVMLGYVFGTAYHAVAGYMGKVLVVAILVSLITIWGYRFVNSRFHIFRRYELFTLILNVLSLGSLAIIIDKLSDETFKLNFDVWISVFMDKFNHLHPYFTTLADWISNIGSTAVTAGLGIIIGVYFLFKKKWRSGTIMLLAVGSTGIVTGLMKEFFLSERPVNALHAIVNDPSFPSGHSSLAAAFFVILAYLLAPKIESWIKREFMIVVCVLAVILIGVSRLVLNVHWFSDVVAGWSLGIFMATASILFVRYVGALVIKK